MTGPGAARVLADKRRQGAVVYGEVMTAALAMDGTQCSKGSWSHGAAYVASPPLRPDADIPDVLMDLLARWTLKISQSPAKQKNKRRKTKRKEKKLAIDKQETWELGRSLLSDENASLI